MAAETLSDTDAARLTCDLSNLATVIRSLNARSESSEHGPMLTDRNVLEWSRRLSVLIRFSKGAFLNKSTNEMTSQPAVVTKLT